MIDVGFCIYCGSKEPPLTREHVMPRGLGGNEAPDGTHEALVLGHATCEPCREITRKIEEECLIGMMGPARKRLGLTRKDRRSPKSKVLVRDRPDGDMTVQEMLDRHLIGGMVLPAYRTAQCFSNATEKDLGVDYRIIVAQSAAFPDGVHSLGVPLNADARVFARLLAKIALGVAVAQAGWDTFVPLVQGIIRGDDPDFHRRVGGFAEELPEPEKLPFLHHIQMKRHDGLLIVEIRLLANHGGPANYVVVGALTSNYVTSKRVRSHRVPMIGLR